MTTELVAPPSAPAYAATEAGIVPGWSPPGSFCYNPYESYVLKCMRTHVDHLVLTSFLAGEVELCFDALGLLVFGLCFCFTSVMSETWQGTIYNYARDPGALAGHGGRGPTLDERAKPNGAT
jgi:hypothetical protein